MDKFSGQIETQSLVDIIQFYAQAHVRVRIQIKCKESLADIWIGNNRMLHAITKQVNGLSTHGIDAFYELMTWTNGQFKVYFEDPEEYTIDRPWTDLLLEYYVLVDEGKVPDPSLNMFNKPSESVDSKPIIEINPKETDFSDLNSEWGTSTLPPKSFSRQHSKSPSQPIIKGFKNKLQTILELDGVLAVSIVDSASGMSLMESSKSNDIDLSVYSAYMVEVLKAHKKFLKNLNIQEKIEDIIINLDKKYHVITIVKHNDNLFIYVILDKENSNLAITRMVLAEVEEQLA